MARKNKLTIFLFIVLLTLSLFGSYKTAYSYYLSGIKAYRSGSYDIAETFLEKALVTSSEIEVDIPEIKLYIGISAFHNKEYDKAKTYLSLFPDNVLAKEILKNINENNLTQKMNFDSFKVYTVTNKTKESTETTTTSFDFITFIIIFLIIFVISIASAGAVIFIVKKLGLINPKGEAPILNEETQNFQNIKNISIDEVINLKLDNVESIWNKSKALKKLLNEVEGNPDTKNIEETNETEEEIKTDVSKSTQEITTLIDDGLKDANIDELESLLDELEETQNIAKKEEVPEISENTAILEEEPIKINKEESEILEKTEEAKQNLNSVSSAIEPEIKLKKDFEKIMKEKENEFEKEAYIAEGFDAISSTIEEENEKSGSKVYSKIQLKKIFKSLFFEINEENLTS